MSLVGFMTRKKEIEKIVFNPEIQPHKPKSSRQSTIEIVCHISILPNNIYNPVNNIFYRIKSKITLFKQAFHYILLLLNLIS